MEFSEDGLRDYYNPKTRKVRTLLYWKGTGLSIREWSIKLGISEYTIKSRLGRGRPISEVLSKTKLTER